MLCAACDGGGEALVLPPVQSQGSEGVMLLNETQTIGDEQSDLELWQGPGAETRADLLSLLVFVSGAESKRLSLLITDARGRVLVEPDAAEFSLNRVLSGQGSVVAAVPVASAALPLTPPYRVVLRRSGAVLAAQDVSVQVWAKYPQQPGTVPTAQALPVQWVFAGGQASAFQLAQATDRARNIWRQAGIELLEEPPVVLDLQLQDQVRHVVVEPRLGSDSPSLRTLLPLSRLSPQQGLALFLVEDIALLPDGELWAVSGGIPVPPVAGTARSGLAVSARLLKQDPRFAGQILAHELGHALGLFHSTEAMIPASLGVALHDGLIDTPDCPASADTNADRTLSSSECRGFDAGNLMFWGTPSGSISLSAAQADICRRSLLTY